MNQSRHQKEKENTPTHKDCSEHELKGESTDLEPKFIPLSYNQRGMWFLQQLHPESAAYNTTLTVRITSTFDIAAFQRALHKLINRHPILRTTYVSHAGEPCQVIHDRAEIDFEIIDAAGWDEHKMRTQVQTEILRPFNLAQDPVMRTRLYSRAEDDHILCWVVHHIAYDGWSNWILLTELKELYAAETGTRAGQSTGAEQHLYRLCRVADRSVSKRGRPGDGRLLGRGA